MTRGQPPNGVPQTEAKARQTGRRLPFRLLVALPWLVAGVLAVAVAVLPIPMPDGFEHRGFIFIGVVALALGALLLLRGRELPTRAHAILGGTGIVLVSLSIYWGGAEMLDASPTEVLYLWLLLYAAYYLPLRAVAALLVLLACSYGAAIAALDPGGDAWLRWLVVVVGISGVALITSQLRARVDYRTSLAQAALESTADGILVVGSDGRWRSFNRNFLRMWRIPEELAESRDDDDAIEYVLDQLVDPARFVAGVRGLYRSPEDESFDELEFKDGRVFERYSKPQLVDDKVVGRVWSFRDVTEKRRAAEQLQHLAEHDPLTDLPNRRRFEQELERELERSGRYGRDGALLLLDLDDFKGVNDGHGHLWGDEVLRAVARLLRSRLRASDVVARLGGDEFAVLLPEADRVRATKLAEELLEVLGTHRFEAGGGTLTLTTSIGVVALADLPEGGPEPTAAADTAMYRAKREGRNRLAVFDPARDASGPAPDDPANQGRRAG